MEENEEVSGIIWIVIGKAGKMSYHSLKQGSRHWKDKFVEREVASDFLLKIEETH